MSLYQGKCFFRRTFKKYGVLMSKMDKEEIPEHGSRWEVKILKKYLFIYAGKNAVINSISGGRNSINSVRNT